ncbi:hypothetical protein B0H67DRAFT_582752 [Lasiosphaeris hirsuta]|uniref:DUF676 domain-containing protein n=1 Tax=Lasiosphaeris hirsuta TaxID=260670 RepID=A0AA40DUQ1_9PEZI|nr:hypothetical protein B0H67DRAFT_582752 [Lasiosphaeris hirsuta]
MSTHSSCAVRARGVRNDAPKGSLEDYVRVAYESHNRWRHLRFFSTCLSVGKYPSISFASQFGRQVGIVIFPSQGMKNGAPKSCPGWDLDDTFDGLTFVHTAPKPEIDICVVHGLNGNAVDTWTRDGQMWPRDFLKSHPQLKPSRIMTYGYSSRIRDDRNISGVAEWASGLLAEVSAARVTLEERSRPIIFICHSLGGLVAREAMIELNRESKLYPGISLKYCGLLFLATPHSGVTLADWSVYLVQLAELTGIRARDFTKMLEAFNYSSRASKRDFGRLPYTPPHECLYETRKMRVGGSKKIIVSADSAGLNGLAAQPMSNVDHKDICRFPTDTHPGYLQIGACLVRIQEQIQQAVAGPPCYFPHALPTQQDQRADKPDVTLSSLDTARQPTPSGIRAGQGIGGSISRSDNTIVIGGGRATGASMTLRDLQGFTGRVEGGTGHGAVIEI